MKSLKNDSVTQLETALQMIRTLRSPKEGCPWLSSKQFDSLFPYFLEELYEYQQAFRAQGPRSPERRQELADLLFQILLHGVLLEEEQSVSFDDILADVIHKLERRHPHVFDPTHPKFSSAEEAGKAWETLKAQEAQKAERKEEAQELMADKIERIPEALPALQRASRIGEKTQGFGFDWDNADQVFAKVSEEFEELQRAQNLSEKREELGDLFFSLAQYARHLDMPPETVANEANQKFLKRFRNMESLALQQGLKWSQLTLTDKESLWQQAKALSF